MNATTKKDPMYLIQYELGGEWYTIARRSRFADATAKARAEYRAMKCAHMTAIIREDDLDAPLLRATFEDNFKL